MADPAVLVGNQKETSRSCSCHVFYVLPREAVQNGVVPECDKQSHRTVSKLKVRACLKGSQLDNQA